MLILSNNTLTEVPRVMFDHMSGHCGPVKVIQKIYHHSELSSFSGPEEKKPIGSMLASYRLAIRGPASNHSAFIHLVIIYPSGSDGGSCSGNSGLNPLKSLNFVKISFLTFSKISLTEL